MKSHIVTAIKAFFVGASMSLPGISGGTTAIILNVYDRILKAVSGFFSPKTFVENLKKNFVFLAVFGISAVLGLITLSKILLFITEKFPLPMHFFFMGAVLGSLPMLAKKTGVKKISPKILISVFVGIAAVFIIDLIPPLSAEATDLTNGFGASELLTFLFSGIAIAIALIIPGISFSHMLLVLGIYETFYEALGSFDIPFLALIGISSLIGIALLIKIFDISMEKYPEITYSMISGFVIGSLKDLYIGLPTAWMIPVCVLTLACGFSLVYAISPKNK